MNRSLPLLGLLPADGVRLAGGGAAAVHARPLRGEPPRGRRPGKFCLNVIYMYMYIVLWGGSI